MRKKLVIALLTLAAASALGASLLSDRDVRVGAVMSMTEKGYSPATTTIKRGEAVRFVNATDDAYLWPASNLHPTHELYPEFDPREPVGPGEEWEFVFEEAGEWTYHDHLKPRIRGTISVVE
ncbi:MAG: cupredoxin domain-containing protein [Candidatus Taylorbacteria bacterium]|nr:cupredoxin domain-containing protein [Candidatus Taylorbacteria bacterium]